MMSCFTPILVEKCMKKILFCILTASFLTGCMSSSTQYKKPDTPHIENTKYINKPFDKIWTATSNSFFTGSSELNDINKATGIVSATFSSSRPTNYVDCGIMIRRFKAKKPFKTFTYHVADSTEYTYDQDDQIYDTKVDAKLTAKIKATVVAAGPGTNITIDIDYILAQDIDSTSQQDGSTKNVKEEIKFSTTKPFKNDEIQCVSNGSLEQTLLDGIE